MYAGAGVSIRDLGAIQRKELQRASCKDGQDSAPGQMKHVWDQTGRSNRGENSIARLHGFSAWVVALQGVVTVTTPALRLHCLRATIIESVNSSSYRKPLSWFLAGTNVILANFIGNTSRSIRICFPLGDQNLCTLSVLFHKW